MTDRCKAIILGSVLGDGSLKIHKRYRNARFAFRHSVVQREYFFWKVKELEEISSRRCYWKQPSDGWGENEKLRYQSRALPELTELFRLLYLRDQFRIARGWLDGLTPLSLAIWWMDDGSLVSDSRQGVFCTDGFSQNGVRTLRDYLGKGWGLKTSIAQITGTSEPERFRLWLRSTEALTKFLKLIVPFIPVPSMLPKVIMLYRNPELQQRWISEVCHLTDFSRYTVERYAAEKRSKWAKFRE